jgi:hypothetical protein
LGFSVYGKEILVRFSDGVCQDPSRLSLIEKLVIACGWCARFVDKPEASQNANKKAIIAAIEVKLSEKLVAKSLRCFGGPKSVEK